MLARQATFRGQLRWLPGYAKRKVHRMLVLTRKSNQSIMIGDDVEVSVLSVVGEKVRIGIQAPHDVPVFRTEIYLEIQRQQGEGKPTEEVRDDVDDALRDLGGPAGDQPSSR
jgi:carbon storage regulator